MLLAELIGEASVAKYGVVNKRTGEDGAVEPGAGQIGAGEVGVGQIGAPEISVLEAGLGEISADQSCPAEIGAGQIGGEQIGAVEIGMSEYAVLHLRPVEAGGQECAGEISTGKISVCPLKTTQIATRTRLESGFRAVAVSVIERRGEPNSGYNADRRGGKKPQFQGFRDGNLLCRVHSAL